MTQIALILWLRAQGTQHKAHGPRRMAHGLLPYAFGLVPCALGLFEYHPQPIAKTLAQTWL